MLHISSIQYRILDFEQFCVAAISHLMEGNGELGTTFKAWPISCLREMGTKLIITEEHALIFSSLSNEIFDAIS